MFSRFRFTPLQFFVHIGSLAPMVILVWDFYNNNLTFNPIQEATLRTGKTALVLLVLSLACTPMNTLFGWRGVLRVRRPLGLYAFFYASVHFLIFVGLDYGFDPNLILEAIFEKRYALVGFLAGLILLGLAITSTKGWQRRLKRTGKSYTNLSMLPESLSLSTMSGWLNLIIANPWRSDLVWQFCWSSGFPQFVSGPVESGTACVSERKFGWMKRRLALDRGGLSN